MADVKFDDFDGGYAAPLNGRASRAVNLVGAALSVALIVGLAVWGYKLAVRDVNGIPVFRALAGPLRVAPEIPGGDVAANQGLSVNAIASAGVAMPLPESLMLAPKGAELAAEDVAGLVGATGAGLIDNVDQAVLAALPQGAVSGLSVSDIAAPDSVAPQEIAAAQDVVQEIVPQTQAEAVELALAVALAEMGLADADLAGADGAGLDVTQAAVKPLRPRLRPQLLPVAAVATAADVVASDVQTVAAVAALEIDSATIAAGTRLVQLGAFDDDAAARAEWAKLQSRFADLIAAKAMVVQSAQSGGRTFYRLRAHGFADEDEARRFCATLLAENVSCIPVAQR